MSKTQNGNAMRVVLASESPTLKRAVLFWFFVIFIPVLLGKLILNVYVEQQLKKLHSTTTILLNEDNNKFIENLKIENFLEWQFADLESKLKLPFKDLDKTFSYQGLPSNLDCKTLETQILKEFKERFGSLPTMLFTLSQDKKNITRFFNKKNENEFKLVGFSALRRLMNHLLKKSTSPNKKLESPKLLTQISRTLLGKYTILPQKNRKILGSFSEKHGGMRVFSYFCFFPEKLVDKGNAIGYFIAFSESEISRKKHLKWATNYLKPQNISRSFSYYKTTKPLNVFEAPKGYFNSIAPLPNSFMRIGSHKGKDLFTKNYYKKELWTYPAKYLFLKSKIFENPDKIFLYKFKGEISIALLVFAFLSLSALKLFCEKKTIKLKIHSKLFLAIITSTILPIALFIVLSQKYVYFLKASRLNSHQQSLIQNLHLLELNLKNYDELQKQKLASFKENLRNKVDGDSKLIESEIDKNMGKLFTGCTFQRNDGLIIEKFPPVKEVYGKDRDQLLFFNEISQGNIFGIFQEMGILHGKYFEKIRKTPKGKKLLAYGKVFENIDRDSFCCQDGEYFETEKSDRSYYRMISFNLFSKKSQNSKSAIIIFIQNIKKIASDYLTKQPDSWRFFLNRDNGILTRTSIFSTNDLDSQELALNDSWPRNANKDHQMVTAANRILGKQNQISWIDYSEDGLPTIFAARKIFGFPLVAVSKSTFTSTVSDDLLLNIVLLIIILYLVFMISILVSSLSDIFIKPIDALLEGTKYLSEGVYPKIDFKHGFELSKVISEFNLMIDGLKERKLLERFISSDVAKSIEEESISLQEHKSERRNVVVLFSHIRNFSDLCQNTSPEKLILLLNLFFAEMEPCIPGNNGAIDKYIGDAIMAVFSSSDSEQQNCKNACKAALEMRNRVEKVNKKLIENNIPTIKIGVGISFGEVIRGKIGSKMGRMDFTVIGDTVNLAARLESFSHSSKAQRIIISSELSKIADTEIKSNLVGKVAIKGKKLPVDVYELVDINV